MLGKVSITELHPRAIFSFNQKSLVCSLECFIYLLSRLSRCSPGDLERMAILLPQSPRCSDYRPESPCPAVWFFVTWRFSHSTFISVRLFFMRHMWARFGFALVLWRTCTSLLCFPYGVEKSLAAQPLFSKWQVHINCSSVFSLERGFMKIWYVLLWISLNRNTLRFPKWNSCSLSFLENSWTSFFFLQVIKKFIVKALHFI